MKKKILLFFVIVIALIIVYLLSLGPSIVGVFPPSNKDQVDPSVSPYVVFSKPVPKEEQNSFLVKTSPSINFSLFWSNDRKTLYIVPGDPLLPGTKYQISVSSSKISYSWSFKTSKINRPFDQGELDRQYNQALESFYSSHTWYERIPPRNDDFFIGYDATKNEFFVDLYPKISSNLSIDEQTKELKKIVLQKFKSIGVDTSSYKIVWTISPR